MIYSHSNYKIELRRINANIHHLAFNQNRNKSLLLKSSLVLCLAITFQIIRNHPLDIVFLFIYLLSISWTLISAYRLIFDYKIIIDNKNKIITKENYKYEQDKVIAILCEEGYFDDASHDERYNLCLQFDSYKETLFDKLTFEECEHFSQKLAKIFSKPIDYRNKSLINRIITYGDD